MRAVDPRKLRMRPLPGVATPSGGSMPDLEAGLDSWLLGGCRRSRLLAAIWARTMSMSRARTLPMSSSRTGAGSIPGWEKTSTPCLKTIRVGWSGC